MNLLTWNCKGGFAAAVKSVHALSPDIAVIPECSQQDAALSLRDLGYTSLWFGADPKRGLAVFAAPGWVLEKAGEPTNTWVAPVKVTGPESFLLIAVWTWHNTNSKYAGYVEQLTEAFTRGPHWFSEESLVIAGDFNSNASFDKHVPGVNHSGVVKFLTEKELTSAYHAHSGEQHGEESASTFHMYHHADKPYHLDYVFLPNKWRDRLTSVNIGAKEEWLRLSDHLPLTAVV